MFCAAVNRSSRRQKAEDFLSWRRIQTCWVGVVTPSTNRPPPGSGRLSDQVELCRTLLRTPVIKDLGRYWTPTTLRRLHIFMVVPRMPYTNNIKPLHLRTKVISAVSHSTVRSNSNHSRTPITRERGGRYAANSGPFDLFWKISQVSLNC